MLLDTITSKRSGVNMSPEYISLETLNANRDAAEWAYWSMVGSWFAGIATFAAVLASLYIAKMRPKPKLKGEITLSAVRRTFWKKGIGINVANLGLLPVNITGIVWHFDGDTTFMHDFAPEGQNLPLKLEHGESGFFFIENDEESPWARDVKQFIIENNGSVDRLRIAINLGTMDRFFIKPDEKVIQVIKDS